MLRGALLAWPFGRQISFCPSCEYCVELRFRYVSEPCGSGRLHYSMPDSLIQIFVFR